MQTDIKTIVITGVSRGLGRALTDGFIARGHRVFGCARSAQAIAELQEKYPTPNAFAEVNVTDNAAVERWSSHVLAAAGPPDLLINNAALINRNNPLWQVSAEEFSLVVDVNLKGVANMIRHFVPAMVGRKHGLIVNLSSGWGRAVDAEVAPYCATKWAIEGLTRALAMELPGGMAAIPLNPGIIDTEMLRSCFGGGASGYPSPTQWAARAVPFLLGIGPRDNGKPLSVP